MAATLQSWARARTRVCGSDARIYWDLDLIFLGPTLFSFPSRHHALPSSRKMAFKVSFLEPTGLHPTLSLSLSPALPSPPSSGCALHTYVVTPSTLFIDRHQFNDALFLSSRNLKSLRSLSGATDLEAPEYATTLWGSAALLEIALPSSRPSSPLSEDDTWKVEIPLHLRYLTPSSNHSAEVISFPWPVVFWACYSEEGTKFPVNPFDRTHLGYETLFGPRTVFYHVPSEGKVLMETISVPVLNAGRAWYVQHATIVAIAVGFLWVLQKLTVAIWGVSERAKGRLQSKKVR